MRAVDVNPQELVLRLQERFVVLLDRFCKDVVIHRVHDEAWACDYDGPKGCVGHVSEEGLIDSVVKAGKALVVECRRTGSFTGDRHFDALAYHSHVLTQETNSGGSWTRSIASN